MSKTINQLLELLNSDPLNHESEMLAYFEDLAKQAPADLQSWAQLMLEYGAKINGSGNNELQTLLLEQGWNPIFTSLVKESNSQNLWFDLELELIRALNYTPGTLFYRRSQQLQNKSLFRFNRDREWQNRSWLATRSMVDHLAAGLIDLMGSTTPRVAILSENRFEVALTDLACLSYGFVNVPIQPAAPADQIEYILRHAEIEGIFVSDSQHLKTIESMLTKLPNLKHIVTYSNVVSKNPITTSFKSVIDEMSNVETMDWLEGIRLSVSLDSIASIMYTSGTTGYPKGIVFTYENIISKRFARSLALNLGQDDRFLCFLPLFHTFGRFLEMWGCIFWGSEYVFSSGKGIQSLLSDLKDIHPTVLISIPKRWQDIYEKINSIIDVHNEPIDEVHPVVKEVTGGKLKWGLSAAGYLSPDVFRFFQTHDLNLHSGYGMTEATGGITMTPTKGYIENSVGIPLPGMQIKLADDGELWVKGAYVSGSYWNPVEPENRPDGWFTTGDIFQQLDNGQIEIVDRKKEIYKNAKGQTIAPQKIENMFRDFDSIYQLFIVGDHQAYNTALVYVNRKNEDIRPIWNDEQELQDYVASVIHSVNSFLAPFERIVDFRLVDRKFDKDHGELTEKGTFKRTVILKNFKALVESLYERPYKSFFMDELEVQIPKWVFLQRGWTQNDLEVDGHFLRHRKKPFSLRIELGEQEIGIGDLNYQFEGQVLQFDEFIRQPAYCIGNKSLEEFLDYSQLRIKALDTAPSWLPGTWVDLESSDEETTSYENDIQAALDNSDNSIEALRPIIYLIYSQTLHPSQSAFRLLARIYSKVGENIRHVIRYAFLRLIRSENLKQSQFAVEQVVALYPANELEKIVAYALDNRLLFTMENNDSSWANINKQKVTLANTYLRWLSNQESDQKSPSVLIQNLVGILFSWSNQYPKYFAAIRSSLISSMVHLPEESELKTLILKVFDALTENFSKGMEEPEAASTNFYESPTIGWDEVIVFDKTVTRDHRKRMFAAFTETPFLTESMFLFFDGLKVALADIPPQGIWITHLRSGNGKVVYRAAIQTNKGRSYKFVINLNDEIEPEQMKAELFWLLACARDSKFDQLVEKLGSYKAEYKLWSEEFIPGLTVKHYFEQAGWSDYSEDNPPPESVWPHFLWTGIFSFASFWKRTRFKKMVCKPIPAKIIIPTHDYHLGGRLVSITGICSEENELAFLENLEFHYATETKNKFSEFDLEVDTSIIYHAIREALGHKHSDHFFNAVLHDPKTSTERVDDITAFLEEVKEHGFQTKSVYFATRRYHRWLSLNEGATLNAKAHFIKDLYRDYNILASEPVYPDARVQLFYWTVFSEADEALKTYLSSLARKLRNQTLNKKSLQSEISQFINAETPDEYDAFFLKRLAFPQLPPSEDIELIATRSTTLDDVEVMVSQHNKKGGVYRIRRAMHPKEIIQLQKLFVKASMDVGFTHEHQFLVALNSKERVIGGLFYRFESDELVYMDKIVVTETSRGSGVSRGLLNEFFNRMRNEHRKVIITGFLQPGFFYKFGFKIEKDQGGLVKYL